MVDIDMVRFVCTGAGSVEDLFGQGYTQPLTDTTDDYVETTVSIDAGIYTFTTYRDLDTGDA